MLVNGFGGHVGGLREFQETEERWACSARYGGNTGLKCNLEMRLIAVKEAAHQILHVDVFGSSNRVKKNKKKKQARVTGVTSRLHHAGLSMKVLSRRNTVT